MKIEHRCLEQRRAKTRLETRSEGEAARLQGYAAVYFNAADPVNTQYPMWDGYIERIMPGAFDEAIGCDDVRCLFNHDPNQVLGRSLSKTLTLETDDVGLFYVCDCPDTTIGRDVSVILARGDVSGSSFGFEVLEAEYREEEGNIWYREVTKVRLYDVGPVTYPAYTGATSEIAKRSLQDAQAEREQLHKALENRRRIERSRRLYALRARRRRGR